jgi:hypothetical protein
MDAEGQTTRAPSGIPLSEPQKRALEFMLANGGKIHRHPGGFWSDATFRSYGRSFAACVINALERRGRIRFTEWKQGRSGHFPIAAELVAGTDQAVSA